jgi:hypothetical protein
MIAIGTIWRLLLISLLIGQEPKIQLVIVKIKPFVNEFTGGSEKKSGLRAGRIFPNCRASG